MSTGLPMISTVYEIDTAAPAQHTTADGISTALPGVVVPLTWTTGGAAIEYSLRIALCSTLQLLPWPQPDCTWALSALVDGRARLSRDALAQAAERAADHPRMTALRAARARRGTERSGQGDLAMATSLRDGRLGQTIEHRTTDDILVTSSRLLELLFRCLSHYASGAVAHAVALRRIPDAAAFAVACSLPRALPLWEVPAERDPDRPVLDHGTELRQTSDAVAIAAGELKATVDELGRRWAEGGALAAAAEIAYLTWDELPEVAGGRLGAQDVQERVLRRRDQVESCRAMAGLGHD